MKITKSWRVALFWILLASGISILWGSAIGMGKTGNGWVDFRAVYYGTRCLLHHHNPYSVSELTAVYRDEGGLRPTETVLALQSVTLYVNVPTTFLLVAPFALMPWAPAQFLWMAVTAVVLIVAAFMMWDLGADYAPRLSLFLICILLANCEVIFCVGNTAGIVVALCLIAVWCFLRGRLALIGVLCLAVSLAMKPHDAGLVWLYFLIAGAPYRKRAIQSLAITAVLGLSAFLWISHVAPHWMQDWSSNMTTISAHGGINEPGPASISRGNAAMVIDLQAAISIFRDDPRIYNSASYLFCGALLLIWAVRTLRLKTSQQSTLLALASVTALTLLVTYHRPWDGKLLLLTVPACAMLYAAGGRAGQVALWVTTAGMILAGDIPLALLTILSNYLHISTAGIYGKILTVMLIRPVSLILLVMAIFYLSMYLRRTTLNLRADSSCAD